MDPDDGVAVGFEFLFDNPEINMKLNDPVDIENDAKDKKADDITKETEQYLEQKQENTDEVEKE